MACLLQRKVVNPRYKKISPDRHFFLYGERDDYYVPVDCGRCINCVNKYKSSWKFRIIKEFEYYNIEQLLHSYYVTLTFAPAYYTENCKEIALRLRLFFERVRKKYKQSPRHFFITERGEDDDGEHRIHLHGFLFNINFPPTLIWKFWNYGFVKVKPCLNDEHSLLEFIGYCTGYVTKEVSDVIIDKGDKPFVFVSPGLGKAYSDDSKNRSYHFNNGNFLTVVQENNIIRALPRYLRNKIFTESQLKQMSKDFFKNVSDDVIPPPPYYIGTEIYEDYTIYQKELTKIKELYFKKYGNEFNKILYGLASPQTSESELGKGLS